ncbi:MAG: cytochrome c3 family protein [Thermodesulfobacteriota bacterium]|nr:cytochrome c3 family protein [Thermodesulfobacteriota bacterium]
MTKSIILTPFFLALLLIPPCQSLAKVTGQCANCHTMHNSQNGSDLSAEPNNTLLTSTCVGCHSSNTSSTTYSLGGCTVPVVNYTGGAPANYLAGGNFYWVADGGGNDDTKGHNVFGIAGQDSEITAAEGAPGFYASCGTAACHATLAVEQTSIPSLGSGCQGCHLNVMHHADDSATVVDSTGGYYRFLSGHMSGNGCGVNGIEDSDWHATKGADDHNEYLGSVGGKTGSAGFYNNGNTMTAYCCGCHGNFHKQQNAGGAWIRHPSDAVLPDTTPDSEYEAYTIYDPNVPVARPDFTGYTEPSATVTPGTDLVMCLSCHRPHGSPYSDILRWDYSLMSAGTTGAGAGNGCFVCHSNKDGV